MLKVNKTSYAILGMLSIEPMTGYDIRQMIDSSTKHFWAESDGQMYPALSKLVKQGLLYCKTTNEKKLHKKKIYTITTSGIAELKKWLLQKPETQSVRNEAMLKFFFGANTQPEIMKEHIEAHRYQAKITLSELFETKRTLLKENQDSDHLPYWLMSLDYGRDIAEAKLHWCENVIKKLKNLQSKSQGIKCQK